MKRFALYAALAVAMLTTAATNAAETGWNGAVNPIAPEAQEIRSKPILERPNRPGHIYGNTVRRWHYHGNPLPMPRDFSASGGMFGR